MRVLLVAIVGVAAWCVVGVGAAVGVPGGLDIAFGTGGIVTTGTGADNGHVVAVYAQGRIAGPSGCGTMRDTFGHTERQLLSNWQMTKWSNDQKG